MIRSLDLMLVLSVGLFALGAFGVLVRRNALLVLMSIELMLNGVNVAVLAFARSFAEGPAAAAGHVLVLMVIGVAAAEAAVGIALVVAVFRARGRVDVEELGELKG